MDKYEELFSPVVKNNIRMAVEKIGIKRVVDAVGLKEVVDAFGGWGKMIDSFGLENVLKEIDLRRVIRAAGPEKVKEALDELARGDEKD
ncbi:MAG: hypothetical protein ACTSWN_10815 [Promethearchaeota archaeon]